MKKKDKLKVLLRDTVIERLKEDIGIMDETAIDELLTFIPVENLIQYLPEEKWVIFKKLWKPKRK